MGILNFFKKTIQNARENQPIDEENALRKGPKSTQKRRSISDETFNTRQFQREILAVALWKYNENKQDYSSAYKYLIEMEDIYLSEKQANEVIETLKLWNDLKSKKDRFNSLVSQAQTLIDSGYREKAFELVYNTYVEDPFDIELVQVISQLADIDKPQSHVLKIFDSLAAVNPQDAYNIKYRKALYLKAKTRFNEALDIFEALNVELPFAWNYYQIAIIQNLLGNTELCLNNLTTTFQLDPDLKQDARSFPELQNLQQDPRFLSLIA